MTPSAQKTGQQGDDERALWAIVRQRMDDKEWSNVELGRKAGISHQSIGRYLSGERSAKITDAFAVLRALGLDPVEATRLAEQHSRTLRDAALATPPVQDDFTMAARRPGAEYAKGNPDVELNELDLP